MNKVKVDTGLQLCYFDKQARYAVGYSFGDIHTSLVQSNVLYFSEDEMDAIAHAEKLAVELSGQYTGRAFHIEFD